MSIWPFKHKKKTKSKPSMEVEIYPEVRRFLKEVEGRNHFATDATLDEHFRLTELLENAPTSKQMEIAEELVAISSEARTKFKEQGWEKLPAHRGFYRLAVNYEKDKMYSEAIKVSRRAKKEGWKGDWDKRIERCESKLDRQHGGK